MSDYGVVSAPGEVRIERILPGPIERVWAYLTDSEKRRTWFAGGPMELREGGAVELVFRNSELGAPGEATPEKFKPAEGMVSRGRVLRCEPPRLLSFAWEETHGGDTEVTFELTAQGKQVRLRLIHGRLADRAAMADVSGGWHAHLEVLGNVLSGGPPRPFWAEVLRLAEEYEARIQPDQAGAAGKAAG